MKMKNKVKSKKRLSDSTEITPHEIKEALKKILTKKRYIHTMGVVQEALKLASNHKADAAKAEIAALLHDCAKCLTPKRILELCEDYDILLDEIMTKVPSQAHGLLGAEIAKRRFHIYDEEILDAIRYHTTGRQNMTLLEKIIYIADCIEPNRQEYPGLQELRQIAYDDLDNAVLLALESTVQHLKRSSEVIHPLSLDAIKSIKTND